MRLMQMVIDGLEFARRDNRACGQLAVAELQRVAEFLVSAKGELDCEVRGGQSEDDRGHFELRLKIKGELQLRCQRCLGALRFPLNLNKRLRLVGPGAEWPEDNVEDEGSDAVEASGEMGVGSLIEDEVLLALPISPRHETCNTPQQQGTKQDASPFAVLRNLKTD